MKVRLILIAGFLQLAGPLAGYAQAKFLLGDQVVSRETYEAALPYVNADRVRLRDFPSTELGTVLRLLPTDSPVNVSFVTIETELIDGTSSPWYRIQLRDGSNQIGWVFGKYLSFRPDYPDTFWNAKAISVARLSRSLFVKQLLTRFLLTADYSVPGNWVVGKTPSRMQEAGPWYPESFQLYTYLTAYGSVVLLYKDGEKRLPILYFSVDVPDSRLPVSVGDGVDKIKGVLGDDFSVDGSQVVFEVDEQFDSFQLLVSVNNGKVGAFAAVRLPE